KHGAMAHGLSLEPADVMPADVDVTGVDPLGGNLLLAHWSASLNEAASRIARLSAPPRVMSGRVTRATGLVIEATGLQLPVGAACRIEISPGHDDWAEAEVVGFDGRTLYLMPQNDISGLPPGARVLPEAPPP